MLKRSLFPLLTLLLVFCSCKDDEDKANIYPPKLWEDWELSEVHFQLRSDHAQVDSWATAVIDTYFQNDGLFSRVELTNKYDLWAMNADSVQVRWKYHISRDKLQIFSKELSEKEKEQEQDFIEGDWVQTPLFRFYVQHKKLHLHTDAELFPELLEHLLRYAPESGTEEELAELIAATRVEELSLDLVYQKYTEVKD